MEQFVVSARKYRPATFQTVVGQMHITSTLQNAIKNKHDYSNVNLQLPINHLNKHKK